MRSNAGRVAAIAAVASATVLVAGCNDDGRELRDPTAPLPAVTTTSTTLPPDLVGPTGAPDAPGP